jgi:cytochrome c-type biogenesis protein
MLEQLLSLLSAGVGGSFGWALLAAFGWGVVSIVFSPCHLASVPLIVGFIATDQDASTKRALRLSLLFSLGVLASIALIGAVTASLGRLLGDLGVVGNVAVAAVFFVFGLSLLGVLPLRWRWFPTATTRRGAPAALGLGLAFGIGLGPCSFAFLAPLLMVVFASAAGEWVLAVGLLAAFSLGHCGVLTLAGTAAQRVQRMTSWSSRSRVTVWVRRVSGALVVLGGVYLLTGEV